MDSIYWVPSRDCNQQCAHCYNDSEPGAQGLSAEEVSRVVAHLPGPDEVFLDRIIVSGGEVLAWPELLFHTLAELRARYAPPGRSMAQTTRLMVQTNGDMLDESHLDRLLDAGVCRIDVASMDRFHPASTRRREPYLRELFLSRGMCEVFEIARDETAEAAGDRPRVFAFWGATEEQWIGPLWPRGRARRKRLSRATPADNFCGNWSGAKHFLDYRGRGSEVNVQLGDVYPCCPMTARPLGNLLEEPLLAILERVAREPVIQALNAGRPEAMGVSRGINEAHGVERSRALGNHCLWCDEFFLKHAPDLLYHGGRTERGGLDLPLVDLELPRS